MLSSLTGITMEKATDDVEAPGGGPHAAGDPPPSTSKQHPSSSRILEWVGLSLRVATLFFLVAGLVVVVVNQIKDLTTNKNGLASSTLHFLDIISYRYIFAGILIALVYIILQIVFSVFRLITGLHKVKMVLYLDFYGDKILSYLLATGAAAAFGASTNTEDDVGGGKTAASLVFVAFFFAALSSIVSSHSLPNHSFMLV